MRPLHSEREKKKISWIYLLRESKESEDTGLSTKGKVILCYSMDNFMVLVILRQGLYILNLKKALMEIFAKLKVSENGELALPCHK